MFKRATFLHLTDAHVSVAGEPFNRDDRKINLPALEPATREAMLAGIFARLEEYLERENRELDGVIFSGDAQMRAATGGHQQVLDLILGRLERFGITPQKIVATPGNHDVPRGTPPSSPERYEAFNAAWRNAGCVTPWLDGLDSVPTTAVERDHHRLVAADGSWAVFPINSSNWSNVTSILPEPLATAWDAIPETMAPKDTDLAAKLRDQLESLARYDMARVSPSQLEVVRGLIAKSPEARGRRPLRLAVLHHHLRAPSLREELKPFADMSNLEQVRAFLRDSEVDVIVHGHKHEHAAVYDHIYGDDEKYARRTLNISGATFEVGHERDAMRLISLEGLPHTPTVTIEPLPLPRGGVGWAPGVPIARKLWVQPNRIGDPVNIASGGPVIVEGDDLDEVYARACAAASDDVARGILVVHLDLADDDGSRLPLPSSYPPPDGLSKDAKDAWLQDLVAWWQLDRSQLEHRIPYVHGSRLRRYGGKIDQIARIIELLRKKASTRAIAVLIDPFKDFNPGASGEEFASFCLVEFVRRDVPGEKPWVEAIAFYRAQEFARWWPVNIAELRFLQREIGTALNFRPGRITTIAADARTIARSPTQVAMPIVDRWLDQAPERLHLLANVLVQRRVAGQAQEQALDEWRRSLSELRSATAAYNTDGVPVAIEGLRTLASYIAVTAESADQGADALAVSLRELADHNQRYERTKQERSDFDLWATTARKQVDAVELLTDARVGQSART